MYSIKIEFSNGQIIVVRSDMTVENIISSREDWVKFSPINELGNTIFMRASAIIALWLTKEEEPLYDIVFLQEQLAGR